MEIDGPKLRRLRERALMTQTELAAAAQLSQGRISQIETGAQPVVPIRTMRDLIAALGCTLDDIERNEEEICS
ncbi:helix-turn-helix transcriptional regulator [Nitrosomonas sp.]|uniref:helix-turn-helix domain-containing protein n=1 Tax=Nitrosomonas sp. TaxID=42353 RepID=UPI0025D3504C|nr:helix-turn-helix transcriptional regulator [Nitrosomonas sp.]